MRFNKFRLLKRSIQAANRRKLLTPSSVLLLMCFSDQHRIMFDRLTSNLTSLQLRSSPVGSVFCVLRHYGFSLFFFLFFFWVILLSSPEVENIFISVSNKILCSDFIRLFSHDIETTEHIQKKPQNHAKILFYCEMLTQTQTLWRLKSRNTLFFLLLFTFSYVDIFKIYFQPLPTEIFYQICLTLKRQNSLIDLKVSIACLIVCS